MNKLHYPLALLLIFFISQISAQEHTIDMVNDTAKVHKLIEKKRDTLRNNVRAIKNTFQALKQLQNIGDWDFVDSHIEDSESLSPIQKSVIRARKAWLHNDFFQAEDHLDELSEAAQNQSDVQRMLARLDIEAWKLKKAETRTKQLLKENPNDIETEKVLVRVLISEKKYDEAMALARKRVKNSSKKAAGYFMEAKVYFWRREIKKAEKALKQGLKRNPLDADARFYYGYAIWRHIDATELDDMVGQWEIALELNPLHFKTHWHLGNGHTNLTFSDYKDPDEDQIRGELEEAETLFSEDSITKAITLTEKVSDSFPKSVIPGLYHASYLYSDFEAEGRQENLEESKRILLDILDDKKHYGPAENALATVIKSKRIPYLKSYDSIHKNLKNPKIENLDDMRKIFPDIDYYPGSIFKGMIWNKLYSTKAYFPFLAALDKDFVVMPLHKDLALAMHNPFFRHNTTFDNRQWMDIRGVGGGAAGIGVVERGAYGERNIILHEYTHLYHQQVLTDKQKRKIRSLYYDAMRKGLALDYYAENNEHEYFAQGVPAYFEPVKVHPLDFKSMNTTSDLKEKDPKLYSFIDDLVADQKAYLNGDKAVMASNWAQIYVNLAKTAGHKDEAYQELDTALTYDDNYLPALLEYAHQLTDADSLAEAESKIKEAEDLKPGYAPIYLTKAEWLEKKQPDSIDKQAGLYKNAYKMETDYQKEGENSQTLRQFYYKHGKLSKALNTAENYIKHGYDVSTYLRDIKEDAQAFTAKQKALLGKEQQIDTLGYLVSQRPSNYSMQLDYVDVLLAYENYKKALDELMPTYENLMASDETRPDFELLIAESYEGMEKKDKMEEHMGKALENADKIKDTPNTLSQFVFNELFRFRLARLLARNDHIEEAEHLIEETDTDKENVLIQSALALTKAEIALQDEDRVDNAIDLLKESLEFYPYQVQSLRHLKNLKEDHGKAADIFEHYKQKGISILE